MLNILSILDYVILALRILICLPLMRFLFRYWDFRKTNGLVWKMRKISLLFVGAILVMQFNAVYNRLQLIVGQDTHGTSDILISLATTVLMAGIVLYCLKELSYIEHYDKSK